MRKVKFVIVLSVFFLSMFSLHSGLGVNAVTSSPTADTLSVIFPHSQDFADWVFQDFKGWYKNQTGNDITVQSVPLDSTAAEEQVATWNGTSPESDIIWGGGAYNFELLRNNPGLNLLEPYQVAEHANYTSSFGDWDLYEPQTGTPSWYAAAISGFGFMWNTEYLTAHDLAPPTTWADLTNYSYFGHIVMCDPSASGSTTATVNQILQYMSTAHGTSAVTTSANMTEAWQYWAKVAGNVGQWTTSSSQVPTKVANGDFGIGIVIDYYSWEQSEAGKPVAFSYGGATTASPDPVAIIHNAPHLAQAKYFMDYITSTQGQSRVGKYRTPANFQATTPADGPVKRAFKSDGTADTSGFPIITPYNSTIDGLVFNRARALFSKWFVVNTDKQTAAWKAINKASGDKKTKALAEYTKLPTGFDGTIGGLLSLDYHTASVTDGWANDGATNFDAAKSEAGGSGGIPGFNFYFVFLAVIPLIAIKKKYSKKN